MQDVVQLPCVFDSKPVIMRAFTAAKTKGKHHGGHNDDYVTKGEYRWLLQYIRQYYILWVAFEEIDTGNDRRVGHAEFIKAVPHMESWGLDMSDPEAMWKECDANGGGQILFDEFCHWAISKHIENDDHEHHE